MEYKLAKELKDAGFPQDSGNPQVHTALCGNFDNPDPECRSENRGVAPTLEELIEACGDGFKALEKDSVAPWYALGITVRGKGLTPTEAVANLWLALNKHE